jgi:hypothetical protein
MRGGVCAPVTASPLAEVVSACDMSMFEGGCFSQPTVASRGNAKGRGCEISSQTVKLPGGDPCVRPWFERVIMSDRLRGSRRPRGNAPSVPCARALAMILRTPSTVVANVAARRGFGNDRWCGGLRIGTVVVDVGEVVLSVLAC